jgi:hypothetical protein
VRRKGKRGEEDCPRIRKWYEERVKPTVKSKSTKMNWFPDVKADAFSNQAARATAAATRAANTDDAWRAPDPPVLEVVVDAGAAEVVEAAFVVVVGELAEVVVVAAVVVVVVVVAAPAVVVALDAEVEAAPVVVVSVPLVVDEAFKQAVEVPAMTVRSRSYAITPVESVMESVTEVPTGRLTVQVNVVDPAGAVVMVSRGAAEGCPPGIAAMM